MKTNSTIAAISTAQGEGGIGVIRVSGDGAIEIADKVFKNINNKKLSDMKGYTAAFGSIVFEGEKLDEAVALVFRAPHSYTGEDVVELSCHGGMYITKQVLRAVFEAGAVPAEAGEFTKRAFLNGKLDLTEAEAVIDIISAKSKSAARSAICVKEGALRKKITEVKDDLLSLTAHLSAWADYPEEDIAEVSEEDILVTCEKAELTLKRLLDTYDSGQAVKQGIDTVIAGRPNVGKSTLMNLLSGTEKSIVTDIPGTTRDVVEDTVLVGDVILRLSDTAGLRDTDDAVEKIGVDRARKKLSQCGLLLAVFDNSRELDSDDLELIEMSREVPTVAIINKTDLQAKLDINKIKSDISNIVYVSAANGEGREDIINAVEKIAGTQNLNPSEGILSNERQRSNVYNALNSVREAKAAVETGMTFDAVTVSLEDAISELLEMTGEKTSDEVIDRVFHNFCVGK
ncbi:MAG: tRNA uridine-5-carboxymethylaminomethyl(34) synthesis GTPase MnmE [Eubacteriales bacterium]|nr:tRNA uridine-5-carboxymethylaminomethyl(34) synthesis GTPase MnmE [Eubacteriales bacterium]